MKTLLTLMGLLAFLGLTATGAELEPGATLPAVTCPDETGSPVALAEAGAAGYTLVYFYPKADTGGCTKQACSLRDAYSVLTEKNVRVFGVSHDGVEAQKKFKEKYNLPFTLLADTENVVANAFGVPTTAGITKRQAYLFKDGKLVWRDLAASTDQQAADVLAQLEAAK